MPPRPAHTTLALMVVGLGCSQGSSATQGGADAGGPEAALDATTGADADRDTGPAQTADAMADAGARDAGSWCASQGLHLFCDDFDHGALALYWDQVEQQHGSPRLDGTTYTSPYESFLASTTTLTQGAVAAVGLSKRVTYLATEMHLAYDMRVDALDPSGSPVLFTTIQMLDSASDILEIINVSVASSGATVDDSATLDGGVAWDQSHPLGPALAQGQWTHLKIDIILPGYDAGPEPGTLTVHIGGSATPAVDHAPLSPAAQPAQPFFYLGVVSATGPSKPVAVRFDDVMFDVQP